MEKYPPSGGYIKGMSIQDKYNTWAAAQYREKVRPSNGLSSSSPRLARRGMRRPTYSLVTVSSAAKLGRSLSPSFSPSHPEISFRPRINQFSQPLFWPCFPSPRKRQRSLF